MLIIELPFANAAGMPYPASLNDIRHATGIDQYWRIRWIEDGEQIDQDYEINTLASMARLARNAGEPVAWRYYPTGL